MNMVGKHIVGRGQDGQVFAQPLLGRAMGAIGRINAGGPQNAQAHAPVFRPALQLRFRIHTPLGAGGGGGHGAGFIHPRAGAIAIHPGGRDIGQRPGR